MAQSPEAVEAARYFVLLSPVAALAANVVAQVVLLRLSRGTHFLRSIVGGFVIGLACLGVLDFIALSQEAPTLDALTKVLLVNTVTYACLGYCYFNFVNLGQSSIRIRLYAEIAAAPQGVSIADITREYDEDALMKMRLQRLRESGDVVEKDGRYCVGRNRLVFIGGLIFSAKRFVLGKDSEFHQVSR